MTGRALPERGGQRGQAAVIVVAALTVLLVTAVVLGRLAGEVGDRVDLQAAADIGALAAARVLRDDGPRVFQPPLLDGRPNPGHLELAELLARARRAGTGAARRNGADAAAVAFPDRDPMAPRRVRVTARRMPRRSLGSPLPGFEATADAVVGVAEPAAAWPRGGDEYDGPLEHRQGKGMRPDVAAAFDRLAAAARADGIELVIVSAFRTNAEQAALYAARPDPTWVAPPGTSLHRLATELDLGPSAAYGWLRANARRFGFVQRYEHEPWHYGYSLNAASRKAVAGGGDGAGARVPDFVPARFAGAFARAAQRWSVSATLLAAQAYRESGFNPFARSSAGAAGIAQFMPATARALGLRDPLDPEAAIDAQAHLMRDLLRRFGAVELALAAYNAGPGPVARCLCVPRIPETQAYVASILGMLRGAGEAASPPAGSPELRLVR